MLSQTQNQLKQSNEAKELSKLVQKYIRSITDTMHHQEDEPQKDHHNVYESKLIFLRSLQAHMDDRFSSQVAMAGFEVLLVQYEKEFEEIQKLILEVALSNYHIYQENLPYQFFTTQKQWFIRFRLDDIDFLNRVIHSDILKEYHSLLLNQSQNIQDWGKIQKDCVDYFRRRDIVRITSVYDPVHCILGFVLQDGQLAISDFYQKYPRIEILILIHLYFSQLFGEVGIVYQRSLQKEIIDFESEIFPIKFNQQWLTRDMVQYLSDEMNWKLKTSNFLKSSPKGLIWQESVNPVNVIMHHNYLLKHVVQEIDQLLSDIGEYDSNYLLNKYKMNIKEPTLFAQYTNIQYYLALRGFIIIAINNPDRLHQLKKYQTKQNRKITKIFYFLIKCTSFSQVSLLQQLFLWMFQYKFGSKVIDCGNMCMDVISHGAYQRILSKKLQTSLQKMVNSEGVKEVVTQINWIEGRYSDQSDRLVEYQELKEFFESTPMIVFSVKNLLGISLINGRIGVSAKLVESTEIEDRAMLLITLIHEAYCHKKRKDSVSADNILTFIPEKLNTRALRIEEPKTDEGESAYYFEDQIFGKRINSISRSQAYYIILEKNWLKPKDRFRKEFKALPGVKEEAFSQEDQWFKCAPSY